MSASRFDRFLATAEMTEVTSQDVIDTAMVLATRGAVALIDARLADLTSALPKLVVEHGDAPMLGRTPMQPASVAFARSVALRGFGG